MLNLRFFLLLLILAIQNCLVHAQIPPYQYTPIKEFKKEQITHECGVAMVRLRQPLSYYTEEYGDSTWGLKKLLTLMDKQRHRGQDGAGMAVVKFDFPAGKEHVRPLRYADQNALDNLIEQALKNAESHYAGELMLGHLRYATHSGSDLKFCQPYLRSHAIACKNLALAGNFNMTNTQDLYRQLQDWGAMPNGDSDTQVILETMCYHLDREYDSLCQQMCPSCQEDIQAASQDLNLLNILRKASSNWDGGYVFCCILGNGDALICRDPAGIRPCFYYLDDEVFAAASEKSALMNTFDLLPEEVLPLKPGHAILIKYNGEIIQKAFTESLPERQCAFERIYFSKANDPEIYQERKALGRQLAAKVYEAIQGDLEHTVFTYVPNSSLAAFQGLVDEVGKLSRHEALKSIQINHGNGALRSSELEKIMPIGVRAEYLVAKNQKLRTFISSDQKRQELGAQLYEVTKGVVTPEDTLVVVDDSIVRGTTFRDFLIPKLIGLNPKKIILVSSAPPVMYPDCYGIDISQLGRFIAFQAAVALLKDNKQNSLLQEVKEICLKQSVLPPMQIKNAVKRIYDQFKQDEISKKVAQLMSPQDSDWKGELQVIYQTIDGLHAAMPNFTGDWYFTGHYPTCGGYKVLNSAYLNWGCGLDSRAY